MARGISPASDRNHHPDGSKADDALTINLDQSDEAAHERYRSRKRVVQSLLFPPVVILIEIISSRARQMSVEILSIRQIKAARALLAWSQVDLAERSGVSYPTIARLETNDGPMGGRKETAQAIRSALEAQGIQFLDEGDTASGVGVVLSR